MLRSRINSWYRRGTRDTQISGLCREESRNAPAAAPQFSGKGALPLLSLPQCGRIVPCVDFDGVADAVAPH
jgi:hypothetical protein